MLGRIEQITVTMGETINVQFFIFKTTSLYSIQYISMLAVRQDFCIGKYIYIFNFL